MTEFRRLEESVEDGGVRIEKYRFVEKRLITRGIPTAAHSSQSMAVVPSTPSAAETTNNAASAARRPARRSPT